MDVDLVPNQVPIEHPLSTLSMYPSSGSTRMLSSSMDPQWPVEYPTFFYLQRQIASNPSCFTGECVHPKKKSYSLGKQNASLYLYNCTYILHIYIYICLYLSSHQRFALIPETITQKSLVITISLAYHVPQILAVFPSPKRAKVTHTHTHIYIYILYLYIHIPSGHLT